jgi:type VI protein secretion system component VasK
VHAVVDPANSEKWLNPSNQSYMQALEELANSIAALPKEIDDKDAGEQQALDRARRAVDGARSADHALGAMVPNTSSRVDVTLTSLFEEPITYAERIISSLPYMYANDPLLVNRSAKSLCASIDALRSKYPFNSASAQEATLQDLNDAFAPANGAFGIFAHLPAVSRVYLRQGATWTPNPSFRGQFSQPFLQSLNNLSEFSDALYGGDPSAGPHFDYTLTLDGTGAVPVELDVDGHTLSYHPKVDEHTHFYHPKKGRQEATGPVSAQLVWPPVTTNPTRLLVKASVELPVQIAGLWSIFRLLGSADREEGNLFIFNTVQFANGSKVLLRDNKGNAITIQIRISTSGHNPFSKGYFGKLRCENFEGWAVGKH